ncbi:hypothetical protein DLJ53_19405 [Acuticoccus sediminis]|uniref:TRAP transporter small permease protein n=1 Tax=Acuticoccus sediminis TaxID=2184697 RepID=A0A8B2NMS0_9HYPH|nr:TRAP transporter small permease subunit [Acuticoccus sediminis]RAH99910.1 hypothetical protein DLJ53_19405 [Acuticoccus sediminis]
MIGGPAGRALTRLDAVLGVLGVVFRQLAIICLLLMLTVTAVTILLRPFDIAYYWMWPWTMILFVWMTFFGLFAVYRFRKDIVIDIVVRRLTSGPAAAMLRTLPPLVLLAVSLTVLSQIPALIAVQGGPIDGALLPGGGELSRLFLTVPMALSMSLVALQSVVDLLLARPTGARAADAAQVGEP